MLFDDPLELEIEGDVCTVCRKCLGEHDALAYIKHDGESRVVYAWVLARSNRPRSMKFFAEALQSDVVDVQRGTAVEGVHLGAMAGTVDLVKRISTGIEVKGVAPAAQFRIAAGNGEARHAHPLSRAFARSAADARLSYRART